MKIIRLQIVGIDHEIGVSIAKLSMVTSDLPERSEGKSDVSMLNFAIFTRESSGQSPFYHD